MKTDAMVWMNFENTMLKEESQTKGYIFCDSIYMKHPWRKIHRPTHQTTGLPEGVGEEWHLKGDENFLEVVVDGCTTLWFLYFKMVNFVWGECYLNF